MDRMREMMKRNGVGGGGANIRIEGANGDSNQSRPNGGSHSVQIQVNGDNSQDLDAILDNPNLPEEFKRMVRDMQKRMQQFGADKGEN